MRSEQCASSGSASGASSSERGAPAAGRRDGRGCRACLERVRMLSGQAPYEGRVQLRKIKEHYVFTIESARRLSP